MADQRDIAPMEPIRTAADRLARLVDMFGERNQEPTFECYACQDTGYMSREIRDKTFGQVCSVSRPCEGTARRACLGSPRAPSGLAIEAGLWVRAKVATDRGVIDAYRERLRRHPHGNELRAAVDRALAREAK